MYLKQVMRFLGANSRAPWLIERGSAFNIELNRIFSENLSKPAQSVTVKILDKVFSREADEPFTLRLYKKGTPLIELVTFLAVYGYLYLLYIGIRNNFATTITPGVKVDKKNKVKSK